jgi:hypothetical protein
MAVEAFPDFDDTGSVQDLEMPAQIAVGQAAQLLQIGKETSVTAGQQRRQDPESRAFVERAIETFVREASGLRG